MNKKDSKIIADAQRDNIPIFIIIAKDVSAVETLQDYLTNCAMDGADHEHRLAVQQRIDEFKQWQLDHPGSVHIAD